MLSVSSKYIKCSRSFYMKSKHGCVFDTTNNKSRRTVDECQRRCKYLRIYVKKPIAMSNLYSQDNFYNKYNDIIYTGSEYIDNDTCSDADCFTY